MIQAKGARLRPAESRPHETKVKQPTILLFGDSHSYAIQRAIEKRIRKGRAVPLIVHRLLKEKNGRDIGDTTFETFLEIVGRLNKNDVVLSMIGGNQHAVFSTIQHPQPFDFFNFGSTAIGSDAAELIPYRVLAELFAHGLRNRDGKSIEALRKATRARVVHVLPPPPKADNAFIERHHESFFSLQGIATTGVSPPVLRLKFWALQTRLLTKFCGKLGVEVMLPPAATLDPRGFLLPAYYASDATHANHIYGELLLREVERRYRTEREAGCAGQ
jgi:hypothetical protein